MLIPSYAFGCLYCCGTLLLLSCAVVWKCTVLSKHACDVYTCAEDIELNHAQCAFLFTWIIVVATDHANSLVFLDYVGLYTVIKCTIFFLLSQKIKLELQQIKKQVMVRYYTDIITN